MAALASTLTTRQVATSPPRLVAIDRFRGGLVVLMVCGDYLAGVQLVPAFLKHAPDIGFTIADTVAPAFIFAIGLNFGASFERRRRADTRDVYRHFLMRYLALIGIGAIISAGGTSVAARPEGWGVLQAIGVAGVICLGLIRLPTWARFAAGMLMLCGYQLLLDTVALGAVLESSHGGFIGALSWAALLVLATAVADLWRRGIRAYALCCVVLTLGAVVAVLIVAVSKNRVSLSYILLSLAICAIAFLIVDLASRAVTDRAGLLSWWGQNALTLYLAHLLLLAFVALPPVPWWYAEAPWWLVAAQLATILTVLSLIARWMSRRTLTVVL